MYPKNKSILHRVTFSSVFFFAGTLHGIQKISFFHDHRKKNEDPVINELALFMGLEFSTALVIQRVFYRKKTTRNSTFCTPGITYSTGTSRNQKYSQKKQTISSGVAC